MTDEVLQEQLTAEGLGPFDDFSPGVPRRIDIDGVPVCVVRVGDGMHAIGDTCTHADISLSEGDVDLDECTIECWKHGSAFSLETGEALTLPATRPVAVYPVSVVDGIVIVGRRGEGAQS